MKCLLVFLSVQQWILLGVIVFTLGCGSKRADDEGPSVEGTGGRGAGGTAPETGGDGSQVTSGGQAPGGAASGGTAGDACTRDSDCMVENECNAATCLSGKCVVFSRPRGASCSAGFCNGVNGCLPCIDDAFQRAIDSGCSTESPVCAESAMPPTCLGCEVDAECDDGNSCTLDVCTNSQCDHSPSPAGSRCGGGICDGSGSAQSCVPCIDDQGFGVDSGCTLESPVCDVERSPAACVSCIGDSDCDDQNDCTQERCEGSRCQYTTVLSGSPCYGGYCNGISGAETCVLRTCRSDADCDDGVACSSEVCGEQLWCVYSTDDAACPDSGDACRPNRCTVGIGCNPVDVSRTQQLLVNGDLDMGDLAWVETSKYYSDVIFLYGYITLFTPHTAPYVAWLGGGEAGMLEENALAQTVSVPEKTTSLELSFFYQVDTEELGDSRNSMKVELLAGPEDEVVQEFATLFNQDESNVWRRFQANIDATPWAGSDVTLRFSGSVNEGYTNFYLDSISLVATICE